MSGDLYSYCDALVAQIASDTRPPLAKLWTRQGPTLRASGGTLEVRANSTEVSWSEDFLYSLTPFHALSVFLADRFRESSLRFSRPLEVHAHLLIQSALLNATRGDTPETASLQARALRDYLAAVLSCLAEGSVEFTLGRRIIGVDMQVDRIDLSESVALVKLTDEELSARMPPFEMVQYGLVTPDLAPLNKVEVRVSRRETLHDFDVLNQGPDRPRVYLRETERVQEAILLMSAEAQIELGSYFVQVSQPQLGPCQRVPLVLSSSSFIFPPMVLGSGHIQQLRNCFEVAQRVQAYPSLKSALHRYALACSRTRPEDSLVDLVIGFESMLLQGLQNELSHRFSLNGSSLSHWILGKPRKESYHLFRNAYAARSSVVHGYGRKLRAARLESLCNELRHLLATFLIWIVQDAPRYQLNTRLEADDWLRLLFESPPPRA